MLTPLLALALTAAQPNILLIHVDDLGWQDTEVPMLAEATPQNLQWRTPNIAGLAADGVVLSNGYASGPVCTPSRVSLLTGQTPGRHHTTFWTLHNNQDTSAKHPRLQPPDWKNAGLQPNSTNLPALLAANGYRTIHAGKAHFGAHGTPGSDPENLGFEVNIAGHGSGAPSSYLGTHNFSHAGKRNKPGETRVWDVPGLSEYYGKDIFLTEALSERSCAEIDRAVSDKRPFFLNFAPYAVHTPVMANKRLLSNYPDLPKHEAAYATMVESVDNAVGDLLARLDANGIADNTIVIFTSDNGGVSGRAGRPKNRNAPLRSGKSSAYEGGTRVPWIVRWPGVTKAGSRLDATVVTHDLYPTLLNAAGIDLPTNHAVEGRDIRGDVGGAPQPPRTIGWNQPHQVHAQAPGIEPFTSIRHDNWKLIVFHDGPRVELYDLATDVGEQHDLSAKRPAITTNMLARMAQWITESDVQTSVSKETGKHIVIPATAPQTRSQPNIIFIYSDDHAAAAVSAHGSTINKTRNIDRIATEGAIFENAFCTNGICAPARAVVLTGLNSHHNGIIDNATRLDPTVPTFPSMLQNAGYQTAMIGKWHLRSDPVGFDHWEVLPGQGHYYAPDFRSTAGTRRINGYVTDITTDLALEWLEEDRDQQKPFMLMLQHKAPHRNWMPGPDHLNTLDDANIPAPATLLDDWNGRLAAEQQEMTIADHTFDFYDLKIDAEYGKVEAGGPDKWMHDVLGRLSAEQRVAWSAAYEPRNADYAAAIDRIAAMDDPDEATAARTHLRYQRYIKDYLRCIASVDDNVGRVLDWLDDEGLTDNTIVIYTSDQGFFLGEHGWYDKRFMYEPSLRVPMVMRWPGVIEPGTRIDQLVQNLDLAPTFLEICGAHSPADAKPMEGASMVPLLTVDNPVWRDAIFYEYYEPMPHAVAAHIGIRTDRWKLIYFPDLDHWELFDLQADPNEMHNLAEISAHAETLATMQQRLEARMSEQFTTTRAPHLDS
ncbi:MAG: sulfatase-like hydrolase/transferase [Phycisphaerales bacterium]|nr:sulfatase-like hydrolase/transferase [Phycisphaerales bacterium]